MQDLLSKQMSAQATSVNNQSGRVIEQLFAGAERGLLEPDTLPIDTVRGFRADQPTRTTLRVVFTDGRASVIGPIVLCGLPSLTVTANGIQAGQRF